MAQLINLRRRRGVARASITRLEKKITDAEAMKYESGIGDRARTLKEKSRHHRHGIQETPSLHCRIV